jgi:hypothetical protein
LLSSIFFIFFKFSNRRGRISFIWILQ